MCGQWAPKDSSIITFQFWNFWCTPHPDFMWMVQTHTQVLMFMCKILYGQVIFSVSKTEILRKYNKVKISKTLSWEQNKTEQKTLNNGGGCEVLYSGHDKTTQTWSQRSYGCLHWTVTRQDRHQSTTNLGGTPRSISQTDNLLSSSGFWGKRQVYLHLCAYRWAH